MSRAAEKQIVELLKEVLQVTKQLVASRAPEAEDPAVTAHIKGIFPHQSKYNPWRAYVWDKAAKKSIYLGAFPSVAKAKAAQTAYRKGAAVVSGTKAKLSLVKQAA